MKLASLPKGLLRDVTKLGDRICVLCGEASEVAIFFGGEHARRSIDVEIGWSGRGYHVVVLGGD